MSKNQNNEFTGLRGIFWPIHSYEIKKFIPLALMFICIIFNYQILRSIKDALLIPVLGAEIISTVKLWGVLPGAVLFMIIYTKLANALSKPKLFYTVSSYFAIFMALFAWVLYPNYQTLHFDFSKAVEMFPNFKWPLLMISNWTFTLFYINAEMWGSVMLSLLFWQFANQITKISEAKRYYSFIGMIGQCGVIVAGYVISYITKIDWGVSTLNETWEINLHWLLSTATLTTVMVMLTYNWMQKNVLTDKRFYNPEESAGAGKKKKAKLSLADSFKYIFSSKYIGLIALLVICYGVTINLVEGLWKASVRLQYPTSNDYMAFMGEFQKYTGIVSVIGMFVGANILRRCSWLLSAIITPIMLGITGALFFIFMNMTKTVEAGYTLMGMNVIMLAVVFGAGQNIISKSIKYSLFDATKEMSYIPLDDELKVKGKAAVDVVGGRLGKSGGAFIQWILLSILPSAQLVDLTNPIFAVFIIFMIVWVFAVINLNKEFVKVSSEKEAVK